MDIATVTQIISSVGFPIACCVALGWYVKDINEKYQAQMQAYQQQMSEYQSELQRLTMQLQNLNSKIEAFLIETKSLND